MKVTAVRIKEDTRDFNLGVLEHLKARVELASVYLFNPEERTHCCEITPSYWLEFLRFDFATLDGQEITEEERDALAELLCCEQGESCYMHCSVVDRRIASNPDCTYTDESDWDSMDDAREFHNGNWVI